jgi:predicted aminopeptidase
MKALAWLLPLLLLPGCYLVRQAEGQLSILFNLRDLDEMLADPSVPDETKSKLRFVREVKDFGEREMGLTRSDNYTAYYDTKGRPITWIVSACAKDRFEPYTWWFPIVGTVPYKGHFRREDAVAEARALEADGYDVHLGGAAAYSTLGYFTDPILSTMIDYPDEQLAALILHELTHGTVWLPGGTDFNEGLASFVGWQGALEFARKRHGVGSVEYDRAVRALAAEELRDARAKEVFLKLAELYRSDAPDKVARRDAVAGIRVNNAEILMMRRYGRYDEWRARFEQAGGDWRRFFPMLTKLPVNFVNMPRHVNEIDGQFR